MTATVSTPRTYFDGSILLSFIGGASHVFDSPQPTLFWDSDIVKG